MRYDFHTSHNSDSPHVEVYASADDGTRIATLLVIPIDEDVDGAERLAQQFIKILEG